MIGLILLILFIVGFFKPFFLLSFFITLVNIESAIGIAAYFGFENIFTSLVSLNKYILFILASQLFFHRKTLFNTAFNKIFSNKMFVISILIFSFYSFLGIFYVDFEFEEILFVSLRRLINFLLMTFIVYYSINDIKQLKIFLLITIFFDSLKSIICLLVYFFSGDQLIVGSYAGMIVFSFTYLLLHSNRILKTSGSILGISSILLVFISGSRRSMIEIFVVVYFLIKENFSIKIFKPIIIFISLILLSSTFFNLDEFTSKIGSSVNLIKSFNDDSIEIKNNWSGRDKLWAYAWEGVKEKPFLGYGFGTSKDVISLFSFGQENRRVHNVYLKVWVELGFIGLLIVFIMFYQYLIVLKKQYVLSSYLNDDLLNSLIFASYITIISTFVVGFFGWSAYLDKNIWLNFAYALSINKLFSRNKNFIGT